MPWDQALGSILRAERPDVEQRRTQMLQLQGEQSVKVCRIDWLECDWKRLDLLPACFLNVSIGRRISVWCVL